MKCRYCNAELKEHSKFCPKCGRAVEEDKPRRKGLIIGIIVLILIFVVGLGAGGLIYYKVVRQRSGQEEALSEKDRPGKYDDEEPEEESSEEDMPEAEPETPAATEGRTLPTMAATEPYTEAAAQAEVPGERRYEIVLLDCTWTEAFEQAKARGGYLAQIGSPEEFNYVCSNVLNTESSRKLKLWIGGARTAGSYEYHWANTDGTYGQEILNSGDFQSLWMTGEPSFRDDSINQEEHYMNMFFYTRENRWVWNDVPDDIIAVVNSYKGSVGYLCEYDQ